ncbi:DUF2062 domain-containing protein [Oscillatoriales cyanobacterium LEGE 11467]|uniref:DUF2062 domain-containing protein n=2 Tax=Zarconia TaxID=2992130 RepID=A0A928VZP2_9CYAN|nr:DUF2062 domain-containing protein [Zarconia navalis LEGE 11467]
MKQRSSLPQQPSPNPRAIAPRFRSSYKKLLRCGRYWYCRLTRTKASTEYLARGLAVGVFAGFFPLFGAQTAIGVLLAIPLRGHKLTAALGTWVSNPLTYIPIFWFNFRVGNELLGAKVSFTPESLQSLEALLELKEEFIATLLVGCLVCGLVGSVFSYLIAAGFIRFWRNRRTHKEDRRCRLDVSAIEPTTATVNSHPSNSIDLS